MPRINRLLLCSCDDTMSIDAATAGAATGAAEVQSVRALCQGDVETATAALGAEGTTLIACGQMAGFFADLAREIGAPEAPLAADIRDRAGWTDAGQAHAKQAALLAEATLGRPATPMRDITSDGVCLIVGGEAALDAARQLADRLTVTCLLEDPPGDLVPTTDFDIATGRLRGASGALGDFEVTVEAYAELDATGRGGARFGKPATRASSRCDILLDLRRGAAPLFPAHEKRDGYLRADPGDPAAVARAALAAAGLEGSFEKPYYIRYDAQICAHSRAGQPGCDRCLNVCPTDAIVPDGDHVLIDPDICAGCGACAAVCPSGAASYDDPPVSFLFARLRTLASAFRQAGGSAPRALFHDARHGAEMIRLSARFGRGLPAGVIPVEVANVEGVGHAELLAALGVGFASAAVLLSPQTTRATVESELAQARAIAGDARLSLIDPGDPEALEELLREAAPAASAIEPMLPQGGRREVTRLAAAALNPGAETPLGLPEGAPYGTIEIDPDACTLCLACVSLCPVGALGDNPERPEVRFQETACLQCGICATACPEDAITLSPRLDLSRQALSYRTLHFEEPFACIECGTPFGVRSTIERIVEKLGGKHWMFQGSDNLRLIQMCDDCRVNAQYHQQGSPFAMGERPRPRTTDDEIAARKKQ